MDATLELAGRVADARFDDLPEPVQEEAVRALVDTLACALGGSQDPALEPMLGLLAGGRAGQQATLIGRGERTDLAAAALLDTLCAGCLDYDGVHVPTRTRPLAAVLGAVLALAEARAAAGTDLVLACVLGVEVACRSAAALGAGHAARGWNASATSAVVGAAAACARLLGLDAARTAHALGIAATQAGGLAEVGMHSLADPAPAFAARNGLVAALLAREGFSASAQALDARRGLLAVLGVDPQPDALTAAWGTPWAITRIAYRHYPCDIGLHPAIDACLQLRRRHALRPRGIEAVQLRVHPQVFEAGREPAPETPAAARASLVHVAATALVDGALGPQQFRPERVRHARIAQLRARVEARADADLAPDEARVLIALHDGKVFERRQRCAFGSLERPMGDADLSAKFRELAADVLATDQAERLLALAWNLRALADVGALARASVAEDELTPAELPGSPLIPR